MGVRQYYTISKVAILLLTRNFSIFVVQYRKVIIYWHLISVLGAPEAQWVKRWPSDLAVWGLSPGGGETFPTIKGVLLHTTFHYHPPIILICLKYC